MNGFHGNHRSSEQGKKGRKVKSHHHDGTCKCSAPFLKLHYNDCPVLTRQCPVHGNILHRDFKEDRISREANAVLTKSNSRTEKLFRPVKSLLTVRDPETKFNFRYCTPKNSSSYETLKPPTDSETLRISLNKAFVEKAKPFVTGQTNRIKKLKQCFHSPSNSIIQKSRSQTLVKQKSEQTRRDFYLMPESPPDEKKYESGFKWFPSGKLSFKSWDKKNDCATPTQEGSNDTVNSKAFGSNSKSKKGLKEIPIFEFPKEATHFVYSSFTFRDTKRSSREKKIPKDGKGRKEVVTETSLSEAITSSDDSVYIAPFLLQPAEIKSEDKKDVETQTTEQKVEPPPPPPPAISIKVVTTAVQTDQMKKDLKDISAQASDRSRELPPAQPEKKTKEAFTQTEEAPEPQDEEPEVVATNLSYVIVPAEPERSDETIYSSVRTGVRKSRSDGDMYQRSKSRTYLHESSSRESILTPYPAKAEESTHNRGNQTRPGQEEQKSQQTSLHEELCNAVSDLTELKNIIYEYFRRAEPYPERQQPMVDTETMTDRLTLMACPQRAVTNAEAQTSRGRVGLVPAGRKTYRCVELDDLERAAVLCICGLCGRDLKRFNISLAGNNTDGTIRDKTEKPNPVDVYSEMIEMKATRTKVQNPESEQSHESSRPVQALSQKPSKKGATYDVCNSSPSTSVVLKQGYKTRQKSESPNGQKKLNEQCKEYRRNSSTPQYGSKKNGKGGKDCPERKTRTKSSEFYYPVIIKPFLSKHFTRMLEEKFNENTSDESDVPVLKQKRTYDKFFEQSNTPAGKKIKQGFEEPPFTKDKSDFYDPLRSSKKEFGLLWPSPTEHICRKHSSKSMDKNLKDSSQSNNLLSSKSRHFRPIPLCDEKSFRELLEFNTSKSIRFLKSNDEGYLYRTWPNGLLAYEADEDSASSADDKKILATPSRDNTPNDEEFYGECTCCVSDSNDTPDALPATEVTEEPDENDWESRSRKPEVESHGRKSCPFSVFPHAAKNTDFAGTFWFGRDHKEK